MEIQSVALLGAGAVGSYVIWGLAQKSGLHFGLIAEGARAEKLRQSCVINDTVYHPWSGA